MVWSNAKVGVLNRFKFETYSKISRIFYKSKLSFEPRLFISDFDGSVIKVDDEEKVINAVYLMNFIAPPSSEFEVGKRTISALHDYHDLLEAYQSIGLLIFRNHSEKYNH